MLIEILHQRIVIPISMCWGKFLIFQIGIKIEIEMVWFRMQITVKIFPKEKQHFGRVEEENGARWEEK